MTYRERIAREFTLDRFGVNGVIDAGALIVGQFAVGRFHSFFLESDDDEGHEKVDVKERENHEVNGKVKSGGRTIAVLRAVAGMGGVEGVVVNGRPTWKG